MKGVVLRWRSDKKLFWQSSQQSSSNGEANEDLSFSQRVEAMMMLPLY